MKTKNGEVLLQHLRKVAAYYETVMTESVNNFKRAEFGDETKDEDKADILLHYLNQFQDYSTKQKLVLLNIADLDTLESYIGNV